MPNLIAYLLAAALLCGQSFSLAQTDDIRG